MASPSVDLLTLEAISPDESIQGWKTQARDGSILAKILEELIKKNKVGSDLIIFFLLLFFKKFFSNFRFFLINWREAISMLLKKMIGTQVSFLVP